MTEVNLGAELNKMKKIAKIAAEVLEFHRNNLNKPTDKQLAIFEHIKEVKREILELLSPVDIFVVYSKDCNGCANPIATAFMVNQADAIERVRHEEDEAEYDERHGVEVYVETEKLE